MKNKKSTIIVALILSFLLAYYVPELEESSIKEFVTLELKEGSLTKTGAVFIFSNKTNDAFSYGEGFELEYKRDNFWVSLDSINDLGFSCMLYVLKGNESKEIVVNWEWYYGELESGEYRLVKSANKTKKNGTNTIKLDVRVELIID